MSDEHKNHGPKWGWARRGGPGGGPPWARFGGGFGGGGPRSRMFGQGDLRFLLLALIADKPSHGYDLIRTIEARFGGNYSPSPGTIYPTLTLLEEQGLIVAAAQDAKKSYTITDAGKDFLKEHADAVAALMARIDVQARGQGHAPMPESVMHAVHTLRMALMGRFSSWSADEQTRVREILEKAARDIASGNKP
ncbi:PadR family transcriptional regulator [Aestuariivirga litoralis]|uniref:PadR family transcriptional regulator n=1 Tax=Aestuariivirga litoralis TaxID=2650924 RepID=UPI0018C6990B|nr:PadR family transcriptional regulator [Aestuariivirga litoralis]MBG1230849.1 PadR family transcriptional regulator [Aestuariivirga litoralis]